MDLHPISIPPTADERAAIDELLGPAGAAPIGLREAAGLRHLLLPGLHAIQDRRGWITPGALGYLCERLQVPPAEAHGVAAFYALFALAERPPVVLHLCDGPACAAAGSAALADELTGRLGPAGEARAGAAWVRSPCLGLCERAPAALLTVAGAPPQAGVTAAGPVDGECCAKAIASRRLPEPPRPRLPQRDRPDPRHPLRLLGRVGGVDSGSLEAYRAAGGYGALRRALERGPAFTIGELVASGLVGRGGAAFPTGRKWESVARASSAVKYVVGNGDESEPGTFKDRLLMEEDPFAVIEALTIAGAAVGADQGFLYVRGEYALAQARLAEAIRQARAAGLLGGDILGQGVRFDLELRRGAGAYVCGEETALFASIEGLRGEPRAKPPFPVEAGLFGRPTLVNNVETLVNVLPIITAGAAAHRALGTPGSPGTRLFCVAGRVERPGVYELPLGVKLSELLSLAGAGPEVTAVLLGGVSGTFLGPDQLDLPLTFEDCKRAGATLGSGAVLVLDRTVPIAPLLAGIAAFFRGESCGQCVPCRVGTVRQEELVARLVECRAPEAAAGERALLGELGQAMRDASICGLGQTATSAVESAVTRLGALFPWPAREGRS